MSLFLKFHFLILLTCRSFIMWLSILVIIFYSIFTKVRWPTNRNTEFCSPSLPQPCCRIWAGVQESSLCHYRYWLDSCPEDVHWTMSDTGWAKCAYGCVYGPWSQGACVFVSHESKFDVNATLETLERYPINTFCAPPTAYRMMVLQQLKRFRFPALRHCMSAGEPLNPEVVEEWKRRTGHVIREGIGQTETVRNGIRLRCSSVRVWVLLGLGNVTSEYPESHYILRICIWSTLTQHWVVEEGRLGEGGVENIAK